MPLNADQIKRSFNEIVDEVLKTRPMDMTKVDLKGAISAADAWLTNNAASFNTALPAKFRASATAAEKAALLGFIAMRRANR